MRCSIPPGTTPAVVMPEIKGAVRLKAGTDFGVCFNPESLREGVAFENHHKPPNTPARNRDEDAG